MEINFFLRGIIIGFSIAAPVGPVGILCIRRTLAEGPTSGLISGLGAATADTIYGFIAGFGLTFISSFLISQQIWLRLIGGGFLCYLGIRAFLISPLKQSSSLKGRGLISAYISTFFLTLTNPMTILSFMAIFAGLGVGSVSKGYIPAGLLVAGVFIGSALWWLLLSNGMGLLGKKFNLAGLRWMNRISGIIITAFGVWALLSLKG